MIQLGISHRVRVLGCLSVGRLVELLYVHRNCMLIRTATLTFTQLLSSEIIGRKLPRL